MPHGVSSPGKADALEALGAETVIDRSAVQDWRAAVRQATGGQLIDAVLDLVGGTMTNALIDVMTERMETERFLEHRALQ